MIVEVDRNGDALQASEPREEIGEDVGVVTVHGDGHGDLREAWRTFAHQ
jgi:hypothetical protein